MAEIVLPQNLSNIWASSGDVLKPSDGKILRGWDAEIPPRQWFNWLDNRQDQAIAHIVQHGIPSWDSTVEYQDDVSYCQGSNGLVYRCLQTHVNQNPVSDTNNQYWRQAFAEQSSGVPSGAIMAFAMNSAPDGWLKANGQAVSRTTYSKLFAAIGTLYGVGNGTSTFNLPDLRGEFLRGFDDNRGVDSGRTIGSSQRGTLVVFDDSGTAATVDSLRGTIAQVSGDPVNMADYNGVSLSYVASNVISSSTLASGAVTRPRNIAQLFCIKF